MTLDPCLPAVVGIPLANGGYAGCAYGSGELSELTGDSYMVLDALKDAGFSGR
jgi:hypothetical protein